MIRDKLDGITRGVYILKSLLCSFRASNRILVSVIAGKSKQEVCL